jgi:hypothetical protein
MFGIGAPEVGLLVTMVFWLTLGLYLLSLAKRLVRAVERIASALEGRESRRGNAGGA